MEITSLDLTVLEREFERLEDGFVQKVYQRGNELTIEIYVPGEDKERLIIGPSYAFISKYKRDNPEKPPGFCMELRKKLGRVDSIYQKGFDRVLVLESGDIQLIAEMFGKGNLLLVEDGKIIGALRQDEWDTRDIVVGEQYEFPESENNPLEESYLELLEEGEIVRRLAIDLSLGGKYAEEICSRASLDKNTEVNDLDSDQEEKLVDELDKMFDQAENPEPVLYRDELPERAAPFPMKTYSEYDMEEFDLFSSALDEYFYRREKQKKEKKKREKFQEKKQGIERQLQQQEHKIKGLKKSSEENREKAEAIYENYNELLEIKQAVEEGIEKHGWKETEKRLKEAENDLASKVEDLNEQERFFIIGTDGYNFKLKPGEDLEAAASRYYDKAKNSEAKIESAKEALEDTKKQLEELEEEDIEFDEGMEDKKQKRSKEWFEKYRWFYSSEGYLILLGRDAQTNEMLVNKHMDSKDIYLHADFDGAPCVVIKKGQDAGEETLQEAAKAAVTFSKTWKAGIGADDVYYVDPEQVTKNPESGEYLGKGAFVIRGDREYLRNVSVEASIGAYNLEDDIYVPVCGPKESIESHCETVIDLEPGRTKKSEIAKNIQGRIRNEEDINLDLDYIIRSLPPGKSSIKN